MKPHGCESLKFQQDRQCMYNCNIEERSLNHCCREKAISIIYSECVCRLSYTTCKGYAQYCILICGVSVPTIFCNIIF
jgi:hypothetical protein